MGNIPVSLWDAGIFFMHLRNLYGVARRNTMKGAKLQIELNNHPFDKELVYVAIGFKGGFITKAYIIDEKEVFFSNYAFFNVLFQYLRIIQAGMALHYDVLRASATISFCTRTVDVVSLLNKVLHNILVYDYHCDIFETAKKVSRENFAKNYKLGEFRAKYKAFEVSDLNKHFRLKELIKNIEELDFDEFVKCAKTLLVPGNISIYVLGDSEKIDLTESTLCEGIVFENNHSVRVWGPGYDSYLRQEAHVVNLARQECNVIIEAYDFMNLQATNFTKLMIMEIFAKQIPQREIDVWVDSLDASMIFFSEELKSYKAVLDKISEEDFLRCKERVLTDYVALMENAPENFVLKALDMLLVDIFIEQYLEFLDKCSYKRFVEICEKAEYRITEAQIALRKDV